MLEDLQSDNQNALQTYFGTPTNQGHTEYLTKATKTCGPYSHMFKYKLSKEEKVEPDLHRPEFVNRERYYSWSAISNDEKMNDDGKLLTLKNVKFEQKFSCRSSLRIRCKPREKPREKLKEISTRQSSVLRESSMGFDNTIKLETKHGVNERRSRDETYEESIEDKEVVEIELDIGSHGYTEGYVYDTEKGYQYPAGRAEAGRESLAKTKLRHLERVSASEVYRRDKYHYDEDGEFLYKAP